MHVSGAIPARLETALEVRDPAARTATIQVDDVVLQDAVMALLNLELPPVDHKANPVEYAQAVEAASRERPVESLVHLERAILDHPMYAEAALRDPAFAEMRAPLAQLISRLTMLAKFEASSAIHTAHALIAGGFGAPELLEHAGTYLQAAQSHLKLESYAASVEAVHRAFVAERLAGWSDFPELKQLLRPVAAAQYELAQKAAEAGDSTAALRYLGQAMRQHPVYAESSADPAFAGMKGPVLDLEARLTAEARAEAEISMAACPAGSLYSAVALAHFGLGTLAGFAQAGYIGELGKRGNTRRRSPAKLRAVLQMRIWRKLPWLTVLLTWLLGGMAVGILSLPFQHGTVAALRHLVFPIWGMGLLGMVLAGLVRSMVMGGHRR